MSLRVLLCTSPERSLAVISSSHALVFRLSVGSFHQATALVSKSSPPQCLVESTALDSIDLTRYETLYPSGVHGTLGLLNVNSDIFLCVITGATLVAAVRPNEHVQRIASVDFCE